MYRRRWGDNINIERGKWDGGMEWINRAQNRDRWQDLREAAMKLWAI